MTGNEDRAKQHLNNSNTEKAKVYAILAVANSIEDSIIKLAKVIDRKKMS